MEDAAGIHRGGEVKAGWRFLAFTISIAGLACTTTHKTSTGRTQRETDSVIGQSSIPGAHVVKRATDTQDSARAQAAALDTAAQ